MIEITNGKSDAVPAAATILVVDDEICVRTSLTVFLRDGGHTVFTASDAAQAEVLLKQKSFDVVVADIVLPGASGVQLVRQIKAEAPDVPVILITAEPAVDTAVAAVRAGAYDYLAKPISRDAILQIVARALNVKALQDENRRLEAANREYQSGLECKIAERTAALSQSEQKFRSYVEKAPTAILTSDLMGHLADSNPMAVEMFGHSADALKSMTFFELFLSEDQEAARQALAALTHQRAVQREFRMARKDGETIYAALSIGCVSPDSVLVYCQDTTERRRTEALALRSQRLEAIGTLAGGVAHDLNNALAPILMGVEMLRGQYGQESKIVDIFDSSARRATDMVRQLLSFAKGVEGERVIIQPAHLIKEMGSMMKSSFPKNIHFALKCAPRVPTIIGNTTQLHQVLLNLCVNARDAMPTGGTLSLEAETVQMDAAYAGSIPDAKPGRYVLLRVRDTGTGIPPQILERIFEPFFTTKGPEKGTGLGLSTVVGIVKGHEGFLHVASQPGHGATFSIYLPADRSVGDVELAATGPEKFLGQSEMVLFVDDEPTVREISRAVLRRLNLTPLTATDGSDGLIKAALHRTKLRAIITDLHMPHLDGLAFVRAIRQMLPKVPVIVASGRVEDNMAADLEALGVTHRLDKPFSEAQLAEVMKSLLPPQQNGTTLKRKRRRATVSPRAAISSIA